MTDSIVVYVDMDQLAVNTHLIAKYNIDINKTLRSKYNITRAAITGTTVSGEPKKSTVRSRLNGKYCIE